MMAFNREALEIPHPTFREGTATLSKRVAAIRLLQQATGNGKLGPITQLDPCLVDLCGPGYNDRTVKVRLNDQCYFVFRDDLN